MNTNDGFPISSWNDSYKINIPVIDEQHKKFLELVDVAKYNLESSAICDNNKIIQELEDYLDYHFTFEEELFENSGYPDLLLHKHKHKQFVEKIRQFKMDAESNNPLIAKKLVEFMSKWFISHILDKDPNYVEYVLNLKNDADKHIEIY